MNCKLEISEDGIALIYKLLGANSKMNRQLIKRERLDVRELPGKQYLANAIISESTMIQIHGQVR